MKNKLLKIYLLAFITIFYFGCIEPFNINIQTEPKPAIASIFSQDDDSIKVLVYWGLTPSQQTEPFIPIENALLKLYEGNNLLCEFSKVPFNEYYACPNNTQIGKNYKLIVYIPEYGELTAQTYLPKPVKIEYLYYDTLILPNQYGVPQRYIDFWLKIKGIYSENLPLGIGMRSFLGITDIIIDDPIIGKWDSRKVYPIIAFRLKNYEDSTYTFKIRTMVAHYTWDTENNREIKDTVAVRFYIITFSEDAYKTVLTFNYSVLGNYYNWNIPLDYFTEPISAYTNVENGYGYFAGYSVDSTEIIGIKVQTTIGLKN